MDKSEDSSEPTIPSVFKPSSTSTHPFDVSETSPSNPTSTKSDHDFTMPINKVNPFKKNSLPDSQHFNVCFEESNVQSDVEQSVVLSKEKLLFKTKSKPVADKFHVSFNETNMNVSSNESLSKSKSVMDDDVNLTDVVNKSNPFKKKNKSGFGMFNVDYDETNDDDSGLTLPASKVLFAKPKRISNLFQVSFNETRNQTINEVMDTDEDRASDGSKDITDIANRTNPFKKPADKSAKDLFQVDFNESSLNDSKTTRSEKLIFKKPNTSFQNYQVSFDETSSQKEKSQEKSENISVSRSLSEKEDSVMEESIAGDEISVRKSIENNAMSYELETTDKNLENSSHEVTERSEYNGTCQSSINDDNLNNWMSDHSDEEMNVPPVPSVTPKISLPKETTEKDISEKEITSTDANASLSWEEKFNQIVSNVRGKTKIQNKEIEKTSKKIENNKKQTQKENYQAPKLTKPARFATKRLYRYIINKIEEKYGVDAIIEAERIVFSICDTVKKVTRRKTHQKKLIQDLKKEMAKMGLIETTIDFYEFIIKFLPYDFRVKVIPSVQPVTNSVFPPRDTGDPFEKIL